MTDLDSASLRALLAGASTTLFRVLLDTLFKYLAAKPFIGVTINVSAGRKIPRMYRDAVIRMLITCYSQGVLQNISLLFIYPIAHGVPPESLARRKSTKITKILRKPPKGVPSRRNRTKTDSLNALVTRIETFVGSLAADIYDDFKMQLFLTGQVEMVNRSSIRRRHHSSLVVQTFSTGNLCVSLRHTLMRAVVSGEMWNSSMATTATP